MRLLITSLLAVVVLAGGAGADTKGLLFYQDFERGELARVGQGWSAPLPHTAQTFVPGRFGQGYRFERPRQNLLSPNQASAEEGLAGFVAAEGVKLAAVGAPTNFGRQVLQAQGTAPGELWSLTPVPTRLTAPHRPTKVFVLSAYVRADQPGAQVRLRLADREEDKPWRDKITRDNQAALEKNPQAKVREPVETVAQAGEITLTDRWQRVMALLELDARRAEHQLVGTLELMAGAPAVVMADGLQLEQAALYPVSNTAPTSWLPGGESRGNPWLEILAADSGFEGKAGTLACWVKALPDECGGTRPPGPALSLGTGWFAPIWTLGGQMWYAGNGYPSGFKTGRFSAGKLDEKLLEPGSREGWHHLALVWDDQEAVGYLNGQPLGRCPIDYARPAHGSVLRLGGSPLERFPFSGDLDEVCLYDRRLSTEEVVRLVERPQALGQDLPPLTLQRPLRLTFLRSQGEAVIPLQPAGRETLTVTAQAPSFKASASGPASAAKPLLLKIKPWLARPGKYPLRVELRQGRQTATVTDEIEIFEEPQGRFIIYGWGDTHDLEQIGLNAAVVGGVGAQRDMLERGLWANSRIDLRDAVPHPWSPQNRRRCEPLARATARSFLANPNVWSCLVNSEMGDPPFPSRENEPWFYEWLKQETGLEGIPPQIVRNPIHVPEQAENPPPAVMPEDYPPLKFMHWWTERGMGWWLLNNQLARWMREEGLAVTYYSDQPEALTQFAEMDLADFWTYPKSPEGFVARVSHASNMARLAGKPLQVMPGTVYWDDGNGLWVTDTDGKRKVLGLSPDCLRQRLWMSVAMPSSSIGIYGLGERKTEIYDRTCDQVMADTYALIQPVGTLVGGLPQEAAPVAMLDSIALSFTQTGAEDNWNRHWVSRNTSRCLARARLPYDWITDDQVAAGWLKRYQAVVLPGAWALPEKTHQALVAYARGGGKVIADEVLRAEIPGVQRLGIKTQNYQKESDLVEAELGGWARQVRENFPAWAQVSPRDRVFTYTREAGAARYLFIINDHRVPGPQYERWKVEFDASDGKGPLRDQGLPQEVTVSVPAGLALYDVLAHKALSARTEKGRQTLTMQLEPGGAALIAALPQAIARLQVDLPARLTPGNQAALQVRLTDRAGKAVTGRQLVEVRITSPEGEWAGVQRYTRVENGVLTLPLRLPLTARRGEWRVTVREWLSGLQSEKRLTVG
jgi:hypothetical protein